MAAHPAHSTSDRDLNTPPGPRQTGPSLGDLPTVAPAPNIEVPGYRVTGLLGEGGMGMVLAARDPSLDREVAIKVIRPGSDDPAKTVARFVTESTITARLAHPGVPPVHALGTLPDGSPYLVMKLVRGRTLLSLLRERASPASDLPRFVRVFEQVAQTVGFAHARGVIHRDLKPANVMVGEFGEVQVMDWGVAKNLDAPPTAAPALTQMGDVVGTPTHMAPEQARGAEPDRRADVFALGAVLCDILTGHPPFAGKTLLDALRRAAQADLAEALDRLAGCGADPELIALATACLSPNPADRPADGGAVANRVAAYQAGVEARKAEAARVSVETAARERRKRRRVQLALAGAVGLLAAASGAFGWWSSRQAEETKRTRAEFDVRQERAAADRLAAETRAAENQALATTREVSALQMIVRQRCVERPAGWVQANLADLRTAGHLAGGDSRARAALRDAAAFTLLRANLGPAEPIARGLTAGSIAVAPTGLVALGEFHTWVGLPCRVWLVDPASGRTVREFTYPAELVRYKGNLTKDGTYALAFGPNGKRLFAGTRAGKILRFDLDKPASTPAFRVAARPDRAAEMASLAVAPDGKTVFGTCGGEQCVFGWNAETGQEMVRLVGTDPAVGPDLQDFAFQPGTGELVAIGGSRVYRWPNGLTAPPGPPRVVHGPWARGISFAAGGRMLLASGDDEIRLLDPDTTEQTGQLLDPDARDDPWRRNHDRCAVHPSGVYVATAARDDYRVVRVWSLGGPELVGTVTVPGTGPLELAWSAAGRYLLMTGPGQTFRVELDIPTAEVLVGLNAAPLVAASFAPDGKQVMALGVTGGPPAGNPRQEVLAAPTNGDPARLVGSAVDPFVPPKPPFHVLTDSTGLIAVGTGHQGLRVYRPGGLLPGRGFSRTGYWMPQFDPDGRVLWVVANETEVVALDRANPDRVLARWPNDKEGLLYGVRQVRTLAVGRSRVVAGARSGSIHVLDAADARWRNVWQVADDPVLSIALSPDENLALGGTQDGKLRRVVLPDEPELPALAAHRGPVLAVAFRRDGEVVATGGSDRVVRLWRRSGSDLTPLLSVDGLPARVRSLQFSPTDNRLLVLLVGEHAARVWDLDRLRRELTDLGLGW